MNCLVTGGAGFVGSNLVRRLLYLGHSVTVWDNLSTGKFENLDWAKYGIKDHPYLKFVLADVDDPPYPEPNVDVIFHLAALARIQPSFASPAVTFDVNCSGTVRMLELARRTKARFVYAGSSSFYFDKYVNPYTFTKWVGEEIAYMYTKVYGVSTATARFFNVYGPNQIREGAYATVLGIFEKQYQEGKPLTITGTGEQRRDFTHVADIVEGLIALGKGEWKGEVFNFGTGTNHSINEVAALFPNAAVEYIPARPGEADVTLADIVQSQEILGWEPKHTLEGYLKELLVK